MLLITKSKLAFCSFASGLAHHLWRAFDKSETFAFQIFLWAIFTMEFGEGGFVFKEINLRG